MNSEKVYEFKWDHSHANTFHKTASSVLEKFSFKLVNNPKKITSRYQTTAAIYQSNLGLFVGVYFDPADGMCATVSTGRCWKHNLENDKSHGWLSNSYSDLAKLLGVEFPSIYHINNSGPDKFDYMYNMLKDMEQTLPTILDKVTLDHIITIENNGHSAKWRAESYYGSDYLDHIKISKFPL